MKIQDIYNLVKNKKLPIHNEKALQLEIEKILNEAGINYKREYRLNKTDIPDFIIGGLAVEIKVKGSVPDIYKQCKRYLQNEQVEALLLITAKPFNHIGKLEGKEFKVLNINTAWL